MSMGAFKWAKSWGGQLTSPQMFVLLMIADHYNDTKRRAWPHIATLATETCLSSSTVKRSIRELKAQGLIEVEQWFDNSTGQQMANRYCLPDYDPRSVAHGPQFAEPGTDGMMTGSSTDGFQPESEWSASVPPGGVHSDPLPRSA